MYQWFDCHFPGVVVSPGISRPNAENCPGFSLVSISDCKSIKPNVLFSSFGCCISKGSPYQIILRSSLCRVAAQKELPVDRFSVVIFTFSDPLGLSDSQLF